MSFKDLIDKLNAVSGQIRPDKELERLNPKSGLYDLISNRSVDNSAGLVDQIAVILPSYM